MRCNKSIIIAITLLLLIHEAYADSSSRVYRLDPNLDGPLITLGSATLYSAYLLGNYQPSLHDEDVNNLSPDDVQSFDRSAVYNNSGTARRWSNYLLYPIVLGPGILLAGKQPRNEAVTLCVMYAESIAINTGLTSIVKTTVRRKRPYVYNTDVSNSEKTDKNSARSFYSGHTATAFNSAVFFSKVFSDYYPNSHWRYAVWAASLSLATTVGACRYLAGKHYPTDIIAGALAGGVWGYIVPVVHKNKNMHISIIPITGKCNGLMVSYCY